MIVVTGHQQCETCHGPLPVQTRGRPRRYCSTACKTHKYRRPCPCCGKLMSPARGKRAPEHCAECNGWIQWRLQRSHYGQAWYERQVWTSPVWRAEYASRRISCQPHSGVKTSRREVNSGPFGTTSAGGQAKIQRARFNERGSRAAVRDRLVARWRRRFTVPDDCKSCVAKDARIVQLRHQVEVMRADMESAQANVVAKDRSIRALKAALTKLREDSPDAVHTKELLEYWRARMGRTSRTYIGLDGDRAAMARTSLKRWGLERCKRAVDGRALAPHAGPMGWTGQPHPGSKRRDDFEYVFGTIKRFEECEARALEHAEHITQNGHAPHTTLRPLPDERVEPLALPDVLARLDGTREGKGGQWTAKCPAHEDRHQSLSIAQGRKGVVVHCHAGCEFHAICAAIDANPKALRDHDEAPAKLHLPDIDRDDEPEPEPDVNVVDPGPVVEYAAGLLTNQRMLARLSELRRWTPEALRALMVGYDPATKRLTFPVRDYKGRLVNVLRYTPSPRGGERKLLGMSGQPRDLFPGPETLPAGRLWIVEGEPDAITARSLGLSGVGLPGANGWRPKWIDRFAGREVVVICDCDEPGRRAAQSVLSQLTGAAASVQLLDLAPERTDGYDLGNAYLDGLTVGELERMLTGLTQLPGMAA